jgi:hypothetical protein
MQSLDNSMRGREKHWTLKHLLIDLINVLPPPVEVTALTIYDSDSRTLIRNDQRSAEINSLNDIVQNADGTTTLYIGPRAPEGMERNWVQTSAGQPWFTYFRLYNPEMPYFDKSWQLNDIEQTQ